MVQNIVIYLKHLDRGGWQLTPYRQLSQRACSTRGNGDRREQIVAAAVALWGTRAETERRLTVLKVWLSATAALAGRRQAASSPLPSTTLGGPFALT